MLVYIREPESLHSLSAHPLNPLATLQRRLLYVQWNLSTEVTIETQLPVLCIGRCP